MKETIARWESRGKKYWLELYYQDNRPTFAGYGYRGSGCGGFLGDLAESDALLYAEKLASVFPSKMRKVL